MTASSLSPEAYLLPFDLLGRKHLIDAHIEGLTPQLAVSALGARGGGISGPGPGAKDVRAALAAEANGALNNEKNKLSGRAGSAEQLPAADRTSVTCVQEREDMAMGPLGAGTAPSLRAEENFPVYVPGVSELSDLNM